MISQSIYTESIYKLYGSVVVAPTATIENICNVENYKFSGSAFTQRQSDVYEKKNSNYLNSYEIFNSSGRRINNLATRDLPISTSFYDTIINGQPLQSKELSRNRNKNIIVTRFSAPGGKRTDSAQNRDLESGEYSSNNNINLRNYEARYTQSIDLQQHTDLNYEATYTKHKINKNQRYVLNSNLAIHSRSDNGYVSYQIPYHKDQILWANQLYNNETERKNHYIVNNVQTGSEFFYTNSMTGSDLYQSFGSDYKLVFGNPTWLQIKSGKNWRYRKIKDNSFYIRNIKDTTNEGRGTRIEPLLLVNSGTFDTSSEGSILFKEPVVDFCPTYTEVVIDDKYVVQNVLFNSKLHNNELNNSFGIIERTNENVLDYLVDTDTKLKIKKTIYPKRKNSSLKRTRSRERFLFTPWKDDYFTVSIDGVTATLNYNDSRRVLDTSYVPYCMPYLTGFYVTGSIWPLDAYIPKNSSLIFASENIVCGELLNYEVNRVSTDAIYSSGNFPVAKYTGLYYYGNGQTEIPAILPWSSFIKANSKPFDNNNAEFEKHISKLYKDYSLIPEYNISNIITNENIERINDILNQNSFNFYITGSDNIDEKSDPFEVKSKLKFEINSVIKLRPYKEFYPALKTLKIASLLSSTFTKVDNFNLYRTAENPYIYWNGVYAGMLPFFNPGILYNSIKAGGPMPCPYYTRSFLDSNNGPPFRTASFETIFDPISFLENKSVMGYQFTESLSSELYKKSIKNFLEEVRYTFCKNNELEYFTSDDEENYKVFESGKEYVMELNVGYGKLDYDSNGMIIGGANYFGDEYTYENSYQPCWNTFGKASFPLADTVRIKFTPSTTRKYTLDEIFANISFDNVLTNNNGIINEDSSYHKISQSFDIIQKVQENGASKWKIKSKWEFPFLIMTNSFMKFITNYQADDSSGQISYFERQQVPEYVLGGLWHDFCDLPNSEQGLFITLKDLGVQEGSVMLQSASLADMVGFTKEKKRVGELNENKQISELICIVPVVKSNNSFIKIDKKSELANENAQYMTKYILPPKLDHISTNIDSIMMFCIEVSDLWSKKDLSYIWQNLLPQNGLNYSHQSYIYEVNEQSLLDSIKDKEVYFMIFKCKMRSVSNPVGKYGPNWPYDDCSLVELVKINAITE